MRPADLKADVAPGTLFLLFLVASLVYYNLVGLIISLGYYDEPIVALILVALVTGSALLPAFFPVVFPLPALNGVFTLIENRLVPGRQNLGIDPQCLKKANRRLLHVVFTDLAASSFLFCAVGLVNHLSLYQRFGSIMMPDRTSYVDVDPRTASQLWADAGKLQFREGSRVDGSRAIAYQPIGEPSTYCVAPVQFQSVEPTAKVEYWAVGVDCCKSANVFSCEDSSLFDAKSAYVLQPFHYMDNILFRAPPIRKYDRFLEAVKMSELKFGLTSSDTPLLLRWKKDPDEIENELASARTFTNIMQEVMVIVLALAVACYCAMAKAPRIYQDFLDEDYIFWPGGSKKPKSSTALDATMMQGAGGQLDATLLNNRSSIGAGRPPGTDASLFTGRQTGGNSPNAPPARPSGGRAARQQASMVSSGGGGPG
ncbi:unnamed protein product [Amoebophrya sp. A120]|nr:unnamed protein product [Amoebophrya sp. A120]|eukprot:GSA120T00017178001.1